MPIRITCISKDGGNHENPYVAISDMNWVEDGSSRTGNSTREVMYDYVVNKNGYAYVQDSRGDKARLIGATTVRGTRYVKTVADETKADNLLRLPECA